ncbi:MAG: hypothetical protein ACLQNE_31340 [Thermoguttaceae bacterium]|jgi:hypothetical protein
MSAASSKPSPRFKGIIRLARKACNLLEKFASLADLRGLSDDGFVGHGQVLGSVYSAIAFISATNASKKAISDSMASLTILLVFFQLSNSSRRSVGTP